MLQKELYEGAYGNEIKAKQLFEKINNLISDLYGKNDEEDEEIIGLDKWSSVKYEIAVNKKSDNTSIELVYVPKITLNDNYISVSRADKPFDKEQNIDKRQIEFAESLSEIVEKNFKESSGKNVVSVETKIRNNVLLIHISKDFPQTERPTDYISNYQAQILTYISFKTASNEMPTFMEGLSLFKEIAFVYIFSFTNSRYATNIDLKRNDFKYLDSITRVEFIEFLKIHQ